ncbi:hypothetical protein ACWESM_18655 [Nocardia sp. NPDC003999]
MADQVIAKATRWGVRLPNGEVRTAASAEEAAKKRNHLRNSIEDEFGVRPADYDPQIVKRTETTTAGPWMAAPFTGLFGPDAKESDRD